MVHGIGVGWGSIEEITFAYLEQVKSKLFECACVLWFIAFWEFHFEEQVPLIFPTDSAAPSFIQHSSPSVQDAWWQLFQFFTFPDAHDCNQSLFIKAEFFQSEELRKFTSEPQFIPRTLPTPFKATSGMGMYRLSSMRLFLLMLQVYF